MIWVITNQFGDVLVENKNNGGSNNIAEILGIRDAVKYAIKNHYEVICINSDSMNSLRWLDSALYSSSPKVGKKINDPVWTISLLKEIKELSKNISLFIRWIPREENLAGHYIEEKYTL